MNATLTENEVNAAHAYNLTPGEAKLFIAIKAAHPRIYQHNERITSGVRRVLVCNLRKKIRPHGYDFNTIHGIGYQLVEVPA